ncbi:MAG: tRNA (adenosine(37)-N6)-threonylcarbamoyltransferase complex ATPase subunit type 1 TsaE, partial [Bacteroidota bacterium]
LKWAVEKLLQFADSRRKWLFTGEIGAGKTTLIQSICAHFSVLEKVTSPTFSLINEYSGSHPKNGASMLFYHMDLYRLDQMQEAIDIGIEDYLYDEHYCFIEWPALIEAILPTEVLKINIEILENSSRKIIFL